MHTVTGRYKITKTSKNEAGNNLNLMDIVLIEMKLWSFFFTKASKWDANKL